MSKQWEPIGVVKRGAFWITRCDQVEVQDHKRDNVKKKLQAMKISTACEGEILKDVFSGVTDGTLFRGLYHSKNPDALDQKLSDLH